MNVKTGVLSREKSLGVFCVALVALCSCLAVGQTAAQISIPREVPRPWRPAFGNLTENPAGQSDTRTNEAAASITPTRGQTPAAQVAAVPGAGQGDQPGPGSFNKITKVTQTLSSLPNEAGQVWREYDISPYTSQIKNSEKPEQALIEWILHETGKEMWFTQPMGILNANQDKLFVYHTPEIHKVIKPIVDRFVYRKGELQSIEINLVTVGNPNWRIDHYSVLQPIEIPSAGVEAWMVSKENAALLLSQLSSRSDFQKHGGGLVQTHDGQQFSMERRSPKQFVRSVRWVPNQQPSYQPLLTHVDEGFDLNVACLNSIDGKTMEACIECNVDQVEKLSTVKINVPAAGGTTQKMSLQIPQVVSWRLLERIRWPSDQVLLLNVGVVANPTPDDGGLRPLSGILGGGRQRSDGLLFLEYEGPAINPNLRHAARGGTTSITPITPR